MAKKEIMITSKWAFPIDIFLQSSDVEFVSNELHFHDCFEIVYVLEGCTTQIINDQEYSLKENDMVLISPNQPHSLNYIPDIPTKNIIVKFLPEIFKPVPIFVESKYILPFVNCAKSTALHFDMNNSVYRSIHSLFLDIYQEYLNKEIGYEISILGKMLQFLALLFRNNLLHSINDEVIPQKHLEVINKFCQYIEDHYQEDIDLRVAAHDLHYSYSYLSRILKNATGKSFTEYLNYVRVCEFEKLIASSDMNISNAAYKVGFVNITSFNKVYKKLRGYTPTDFLRYKRT